jgi:hypothetical protein
MPSNTRKWLTAIAVGGGLLISASPAHATETAPTATAHGAGVMAVPAAVGSKAQICLKNSSNYCLQSNGAGSQVTITNNSSNYSTFTVARIEDTVNGTEYEWQNASGNCLRQGGSNMVIIKNGSCSASDRSDLWQAFQGRVQNDFTAQIMLVRGQPKTGNKVFAFSTTPSGDWAKWNVPT